MGPAEIQVIVAVAGRHAKTGEVFVAFTGRRGLCTIRRVQSSGSLPLDDRERAEGALVDAVQAALGAQEPVPFGKMSELHALWTKQVEETRASLVGNAGDEYVVEVAS